MEFVISPPFNSSFLLPCPSKKLEEKMSSSSTAIGQGRGINESCFSTQKKTVLIGLVIAVMAVAVAVIGIYKDRMIERLCMNENKKDVVFFTCSRVCGDRLIESAVENTTLAWDILVNCTERCTTLYAKFKLLNP